MAGLSVKPRTFRVKQETLKELSRISYDYYQSSRYGPVLRYALAQFLSLSQAKQDKIWNRFGEAVERYAFQTPEQPMTDACVGMTPHLDAELEVLARYYGSARAQVFRVVAEWFVSLPRYNGTATGKKVPA